MKEYESMDEYRYEMAREHEAQERSGVDEVPVKVKRLHPDAIIPKYAKPGDAGFDLVAVEEVIIAPGETFLVSTGLAFEIPEGYELQIRPRSGMSAKTKLRIANAPGTIDSGYRGEVKIIVNNIDEWNSFAEMIAPGDRIAQGVLQRVPKARFEVVESLSESDRGEGGFGSTGK